MRTIVYAIMFSALLFAAVGCGGQDKASKFNAFRSSPQEEAAPSRDIAPAEQADAQMLGFEDAGFQPLGGGGKAKQEPKGNAAPAPAVPRKIIYNSDVKMVVDDLPKAEESLRQLLKKYEGFVAQSEFSGSTGSRRSGHWRLRIPVESFDAFLTELIKLGIPEVNKTDSQDVTDQFYDLEARIKNKKSEEESLRKLLEQTTGKMEDILGVRRELNQVRGDIDQKEGQLRRLANLSSLTTVNVTLREEKDYQPPQAPTFASNIASTFSSSIDLLQSVGKGLVLFVVAVTPWLPLVLIVTVPAWVVIRRRRPLRVQPETPHSTAQQSA
jgi:hypothetical protein